MKLDLSFLKDLGIEKKNYGASFGEWIRNEAAPVLKSVTPITGEIIGEVYQATVEDYELVLERAQKAFLEWRRIPAPKRGEMGEVQEMIDIADFAVGLSRQLYGLTIQSERSKHRMMEQWHPLGPVGIITAFNFPVAVWSWNALIAAVCGDVMIWKPSSQTPLCAIAVQNIVDRVTGSIPMGRRVAEHVGKRLGKTILELGGNNAVIIAPSADLDMALRAVLFGAVGTAGQRCTTTRRLIIHESIYDKFKEQLIHVYKQVKIGNPLDENILMGPLVDRAAVETMQAALDQLKCEGGRVLYGGEVLRGPEYPGGCYVRPCIAEAENHFEIVQHETFAPILYLMKYKTLKEAIALHNSVPQGLSSAMFTNDVREMETFLSPEGSDCGIANINIGTSGAEIGGAFGGEKETGGGRESGSDAWKAYMRRQNNTINYGTELPLAQGIKFGNM